MVGGKISMRCGHVNALLYFLDNWDEYPSEYVDINKLDSEGILSALTLLEDKGYCDMCNYCPGCSEETRTLKACGEQL